MIVTKQERPFYWGIFMVEQVFGEQIENMHIITNWIDEAALEARRQ